jgi:hypothetical protein
MSMHAVIRSAHVARRTSRNVRVAASARRRAYSYHQASRRVNVRATPIPDVGAAGKDQSRIGPLMRKMLTVYGYHPVESMTARRKSLVRAIRVESALAVFKRLHAIGMITKAKLPTASMIYRRDRNWIAEKYLGRK